MLEFIEDHLDATIMLHHFKLCPPRNALFFLISKAQLAINLAANS